MTIKSLWLTFKKKYILILFLPILISSYQFSSIYSQNNNYTNSIFVTFDIDNYVLLADLLQKISDDNLKNHYITDPIVSASASLNSAYQFKIILSSKSLESLKKSTELVKTEITSIAASLSPTIKKRCTESILQLMDDIKAIPVIAKENQINQIEAKLQLRTKNCINLFKQASNLVDFSLKKSDTKFNKNQINALLIMLTSDLKKIPNLKIDQPRLEIGEQFETPNKIKAKEVVSIFLSFFVGTLFITASLANIKQNG